MLLEWMGMHALLMYTLVACGVLPAALQGFYWGSPDNNLVPLHILLTASSLQSRSLFFTELEF